jgi:hypothetical protein
MVPMETKPTASTVYPQKSSCVLPLLTCLGGVDLDLVMDEISLSQGVSLWCFSWCPTVKLTRLTDFGLWFGKSVFEGILAEIIHKEHSGHTAVTLVVREAICSRISSHTLTIYKDVLEVMVAVYFPSVTGAGKEEMSPQQPHEVFYRFIHDRRCDTSDSEWEAFRQHLSSDIAVGCKRLWDENVPELHGISLSTPYKTSMVPTPTIDVSNGASSSSSFSSSSTPSPVSSHRQHSAKSLSGKNGTSQSQPALQPLASPAPAPRRAVEMPRYTSALNEHAAIQGETLTYEKKQLNLSPSSWQCTAIFGEISGVGTGRNSTQAKHEASKQICELIDLMVL